MKKILFITYYWPPSGGAGVQRSLKFVKYLPDFGIDPFVLTVDERYASYPLWDEALSKEIPENIKVFKSKSIEVLKMHSLFTKKENIPHGGFANSNKEKLFQKILRFLRGNLFIPDARIGWIRFAEKAAAGIIKKEKIDTVFISSPPHSSQLIGLRLKKKFNIRLIADLRDPWTDIYFYKDLLHTKRAAAKDAKYELEVLNYADEVITVSAPIMEIFLKKKSTLSHAKFHILPNGYDESDFQNIVKPVENLFCITYVGSIADSYKPDVFFEILGKVVNEFGKVNFRMRFVGSMPESIKQKINTYHLNGITEFVSQVSHNQAIQFMQESTILLLLIPEVPNNYGILTGKLFEYLASRRPVIGLGPVGGEASAILNECEAGKMFSRNDSECLYSYLKLLILKWQQENDFVVTNEKYFKYSRKTLAKNLASIILEVPKKI